MTPLPASYSDKMKITSPINQHLTAHDKKLIRFCIESRIDSCRTSKKTVTLTGGNTHRGITPTHVEITTTETDAFGKLRKRARRIPFTVNKPKQTKDLAPNHPELF